jgi:hypothetical protein
LFNRYEKITIVGSKIYLNDFSIYAVNEILLEKLKEDFFVSFFDYSFKKEFIALPLDKGLFKD